MTNKINKYKVHYSWRGSLYGEEEVSAVLDVILNRDTFSCGPYRDEFETKFAAYIGSKYALTVPSCTVALRMATYLLKLQPGDEVISTPLTYQASITDLLNYNCEVRFCDLDPNSLGLDPQKLEALINPKTKAIFLTHYGGLMNDMEAIMKIAKKHNIIVVEDCAHAHGSSIMNKISGATADIGCFSFQSLKNMTTLGEGGMITFNNDNWKETISTIRSVEPDAEFVKRQSTDLGKYPMPSDSIYRHEKNAYTYDCKNLRYGGTNGTLSEPASAFGIAQLAKLDQFNERRREIGHRLNESLGDIPEIRLQIEPPNYKHVYHLFTFFVKPEANFDNSELAKAIDDAGVEVVLRYFPLHLLPEWRSHGKGHGIGECPVAENIWFYQLVNLPIYPSMTDSQVEFMIDVVKESCEKLRTQKAKPEDLKPN
jgi:perosamine synthetase